MATTMTNPSFHVSLYTLTWSSPRGDVFYTSTYYQSWENSLPCSFQWFFTHMGYRVQSAAQRDWDPSQWHHHLPLYPTSGHTGTAFSDPERGHRSQPSPKTNQVNFLMVEEKIKFHENNALGNYLSLISSPELSCPIRSFWRSPKSTASTVNSLIMPCSNLFL